MNNNRRGNLEKAISLIMEAEEILRVCGEEEQDYADNMPENMQTSEKYEQAENWAAEIIDMADECENIISTITECAS